VCYALLSDVVDWNASTESNTENISAWKTWDEQFERSRWFTRGWTLQELIAPSEVMFFNNSWITLCDKRGYAREIADITNIPDHILLTGDVFGSSIAQRMNWASKRETTRLEDMAYCLLGIFDVNMPLLYGEGEKSFQRLQEEIIKVASDDSIFAWRAKDSTYATWRSLFARSPSEFEHSKYTFPEETNSMEEPITMHTAISLSLNLIQSDAPQGVWDSGTEFIAILNCSDSLASWVKRNQVGIYLQKLGPNEFVRVRPNKIEYRGKEGTRTKISIKRRLDYNPWFALQPCFRIRGFVIKSTTSDGAIEATELKDHWDSQKDIFKFHENSICQGETQNATILMPIRDQRISLVVTYDPQKIYRRGFCTVYLKYKRDDVGIHDRSMIRVIDDEAFIVVNIDVHMYGKTWSIKAPSPMAEKS
jgi:hypothetical protein